VENEKEILLVPMIWQLQVLPLLFLDRRTLRSVGHSCVERSSGGNSYSDVDAAAVARIWGPNG